MDKLKLFILGNREPAYSNKLSTQLLLSCRALVGGYLLYLGYGLIEGIQTAETSKMRTIIIVAIIAFFAFGGLFFYDNVRNLMIGRYVGGKLDLGDNPNNALDCRDEEDYDDVVTEDEAVEEMAAEAMNDKDEEDA